MLIPALITLAERRKEERLLTDIPDFRSAIFRWEKGPCKVGTHEVGVLNTSASGLALLLTEKDEDLFRSLQSGDRVSGMTLFAESALTVVNGTVRHKTTIDKGAYQGCFVIGLETESDPTPAKGEFGLSRV